MLSIIYQTFGLPVDSFIFSIDTPLTKLYFIYSNIRLNIDLPVY